MNKQYSISANGQDFGVYKGTNVAEVCESFAHDAGYASWDAMTEQAIEEAGAGTIEIREIYASGEVGPDIAPDQQSQT